jgi:hypothetical protein
MTAAVDDYKKPFCVEWSNDPNSSAPPHQYFDDFHDALAFAEARAKLFACIWFAEVGTYETSFGNKREDWIYWWWTEATGYGVADQCKRRWGYPFDYPRQLTAYMPLYELTKSTEK